MQSGFRPEYSTQDVLVKMLDDWQRGIDADHIIASLFLDLSKAFDTINHTYLLQIQKLELNFGVRGCEHDWFHKYLQGRRQRVMIGSAVSTWLTPKHGVPQGSIGAFQNPPTFGEYL